MWRCQRRPSLPVLGSMAALALQSEVFVSDLRSAVTGQCIVPQLLKRTGQWLLVMVVAAMCSYSCSEAENSGCEPHSCGLEIEK